jgi:DnaJ-class molecular chaperone
MSDEIREAAEKWVQSLVKKGYSRFDPCDMGEAYITGATSRDAEISELVEALKVLLTNNELGEVESQRLGLPRMTEARQTARSALSRYTKTQCPECDGQGRITTVHDFVAVHEDCPDCQGRGYKWERKG